MKVLLIALADSVHTARWVSQIADQGWDVRLFPSLDHGIVHPELSSIPVYHTLGGQRGHLEQKLRWQRSRLFSGVRAAIGMRIFPLLWPRRRMRQLHRVIADFQPDIVHSLEFQAAGYLTAAVKREQGGMFPPWIVTNWGSDIYYFRQFPAHEEKIREVLAQCDYYACECQRDVCLAEAYGFKSQVLPVLPNAGGFDLQEVAALRQPGPVSTRRIVMLKGYQHWVGRALLGLAALELCAEHLCGYEVVIHSPSRETRQAAASFAKRTGLKVTILPPGTEHRDVLKWYGQARVALGLSLSDGISTSFLEALVMGAFPIQSWTACADEWIVDGQTGILVSPEDVTVVAAALRRALTDDDMVECAAEINLVTAQQRLDQRYIREQAINYYRTVARDRGIA